MGVTTWLWQCPHCRLQYTSHRLSTIQLKCTCGIVMIAARQDDPLIDCGDFTLRIVARVREVT
jgi:hypothetical protein